MAVSKGIMSKAGSEGPFRLITTIGVADRPDVPLGHYCRANAQCMAMTHNTIFRGFNNIYHHALQVRPGTHETFDFLDYCSVVYEFVNCHHESEERFYFPMLEEATGIPGLMESNIEQHHMFEEGLERFRRFAVETKPERYDGTVLRGIIDDLAGPLEQHLHDEIPSILDLHSVIKSKDLKRIYAVMHNECAKMTNKFRIAPYVFGCQDKDFLLDGQKVAFPEVPSFVPYIVALLVAPWYGRLWKYNPYDMHGKQLESAAESVFDSGIGNALQVSPLYATVLSDGLMASSVGLMWALLLFVMMLHPQEV